MCGCSHGSGGVRNNGSLFLPTWNRLASVPLLEKVMESWGRKPDPESALRGFEIAAMTWRRVVSCGLPSTNQNGIGRWLPPIQAFKMDLSHIVSPLRKDHSNKDKRKEAKKCFNPAWKGVVSCNEKNMMSKLVQAQGGLNCFRKFYWRRCNVDNRPLTSIYFFILLNWMNFPLDRVQPGPICNEKEEAGI